MTVTGNTCCGRWAGIILWGIGGAASLFAQERVPHSETSAGILLTQDEISWLRDRKVIRYGSDPAWPPFSMRTREGHEGIDHDLVGLFSDRLGVKFEYVPTGSWDETLRELNRGSVDFVTGLANLPERGVEVLYTKPYVALPVVMIMRSDGPFFASLEQIENEGLTLAAPSGYAPTVYIEQNYPGIRLLRTGSSVEALRRVSDGSADGTVENIGVAAHLIRENGLLNLKIAGPTGHHFDPAFGVSPEHPELRSILEKLLDSVTREEQLTLFQKWMLLEISRMWEWRKVALICGLVAGIAAFFIGLIFASNRRLARELKKRREVEDTLRQSEERFRHLFERMDQAYFLTRVDGKIQFVNETAVALLGIGSRPVIERLSLPNFMQRPSEMAAIVAALRSGEMRSDRTVTFLRADGSEIHCRCRICLLGGEGENDGSAGIEWLVQSVA